VEEKTVYATRYGKKRSDVPQKGVTGKIKAFLRGKKETGVLREKKKKHTTQER